MNKIEYGKYIAFHPGYYVKDYMEGAGMSQEELAMRLDTSAKYVSDLVNGRINLTPEMALRLSLTFNTSTKLWLNLNQKYIEVKLLIEQEKRMKEEYELAKHLDYRFWSDLGLVDKNAIGAKKAIELLGLFRISSLNVLRERDFIVNFRSSAFDISDVNIMNANAWVQTAINFAYKKETQKFQKKKLLSAISEIRAMTHMAPAEFLPMLDKLFSDCGVAFVLLPYLKNSNVYGAVKWLGKDKVMIAINDRRKYLDVFWFSLFHEIGHVLQQRLKVLNISGEGDWGLESNALLTRLEVEANIFAQDSLIPPSKYFELLETSDGKYTPEKICEFAKEIGIHPGLVVARLQQDNWLSHNSHCNSLKEKYDDKSLLSNMVSLGLECNFKLR